MSKYVLSTMTMAVAYTFYVDQPGMQMPVVKKKITVHGGAGLPNSSNPFGHQSKDESGAPMWTPEGVITPIKDEDFEVLKTHPLFQAHEKADWIRVLDKDITGNHKAVVKEVQTMQQKDGFSQKTPGDIGKHIKSSTGQRETDGHRI